MFSNREINKWVIIVNTKINVYLLYLEKNLRNRILVESLWHFTKKGECCDEHSIDHHSYALTICIRLHSYISNKYDSAPTVI